MLCLKRILAIIPALSAFLLPMMQLTNFIFDGGADTHQAQPLLNPPLD